MINPVDGAIQFLKKQGLAWFETFSKFLVCVAAQRQRKFEKQLSRLPKQLQCSSVRIVLYLSWTFVFSCFQAVANSFEGHMAQLSDVQERGSRLRERCNSEGRVTIDDKLRNLQRRWSDVKEKISRKVQVVEGEIDEWSTFTKELDQRLTELRNADISLGVVIISTAELAVLEDQLANVKVCNHGDVLTLFFSFLGTSKEERSRI